MTALVPSHWRLSVHDPSDVVRFISPDDQSWVAFYETSADPRRADEHFESFAQVEGERVTYMRRTPAWTVVSGFTGDRIFYRKIAMACGGRKWRHIAFEYPADRKREMDLVVTRLSHAFEANDDRGCERS